MGVVYGVVYLFFASILLAVITAMADDSVCRAKIRDVGLIKTWYPVVLMVGVFGAYLLWALNSLASMDWSMFPVGG